MLVLFLTSITSSNYFCDNQMRLSCDETNLNLDTNGLNQNISRFANGNNHLLYPFEGSSYSFGKHYFLYEDKKITSE